MKSWSEQDAKARFGEMLERCMNDGPQVVTKCGVEAAVLVAVAEWRRLNEGAPPSLKEWLLAPAPRGDIPVPKRGRLKHRPPPKLD